MALDLKRIGSLIRLSRDGSRYENGRFAPFTSKFIEPGGLYSFTPDGRSAADGTYRYDGMSDNGHRPGSVLKIPMQAGFASMVHPGGVATWFDVI